METLKQVVWQLQVAHLQKWGAVHGIIIGSGDPRKAVTGQSVPQEESGDNTPTSIQALENK